MYNVHVGAISKFKRDKKDFQRRIDVGDVMKSTVKYYQLRARYLESNNNLSAYAKITEDEVLTYNMAAPKKEWLAAAVPIKTWKQRYLKHWKPISYKRLMLEML